MRIAAAQSQAALFTQQDGTNAIAVGIAGSKPFARVGAAQIQSSIDLTPNAWHHVAATLGGGKLTLYVDGKPVGETAAAVPEMGGDIVIGAGFTGDLDEVALASVARSADWIKAAWAGQGPRRSSSPSARTSRPAAAGHSYFRILLERGDARRLGGDRDPDGDDGHQLCVMIGKGVFVVRTDKANQVFLERFQQDPDAHARPGARAAARPPQDPARLLAVPPLSRRPARAGASLRAYESTRPVAGTLSPQAIGAIKASLDAGMVRESARLNKQMVLLTIAISGGPFLGLLGTVVGVMITFAAIAAAGDVNVNSIAPGIAAALVATVAGLGVAIPALFGYNYLASRIKNITNDMAVFADELVSRMAEKYAP